MNKLFGFVFFAAVAAVCIFWLGQQTSAPTSGFVYRPLNIAPEPRVGVERPTATAVKAVDCFYNKNSLEVVCKMGPATSRGLDHTDAQWTVVLAGRNASASNVVLRNMIEGKRYAFAVKDGGYHAVLSGTETAPVTEPEMKHRLDFICQTAQSYAQLAKQAPDVPQDPAMMGPIVRGGWLNPHLWPEGWAQECGAPECYHPPQLLRPAPGAANPNPVS